MPDESLPTAASDGQHGALCERLARAADRLAAGEWLVPLAARPSVDNLRDYASGDDFSAIDWHLCARHDELRCRVARGAEDRFVHLLIDCSHRLSVQRQSWLAARDWSELLAGTALAQASCRLGVVAIGAGAPRVFGPARGRAGHAAMRAFVAGLQPSGQPGGDGDLSAAIGQFVRANPRRGLAVVVSDFAATARPIDGLERLVAAGFEPFVARIAGARPTSADCLGPVDMAGAGSGERRRLTLRSGDLAAYDAAADRHARRLFRYCARRGFGRVEIDPGLDTVAALKRLLAPAIWNFTSRRRQ